MFLHVPIPVREILSLICFPNLENVSESLSADLQCRGITEDWGNVQ